MKAKRFKSLLCFTHDFCSSLINESEKKQQPNAEKKQSNLMFYCVEARFFHGSFFCCYCCITLLNHTFFFITYLNIFLSRIFFVLQRELASSYKYSGNYFRKLRAWILFCCSFIRRTQTTTNKTRCVVYTVCQIPIHDGIGSKHIIFFRTRAAFLFV